LVIAPRSPAPLRLTRLAARATGLEEPAPSTAILSRAFGWEFGGMSRQILSFNVHQSFGAKGLSGSMGLSCRGRTGPRNLRGTVISGLATLQRVGRPLRLRSAALCPFAPPPPPLAIAVTFAPFGAFGFALGRRRPALWRGWRLHLEVIEYPILQPVGGNFLGCGFRFNERLGCICLRCGGSFGFKLSLSPTPASVAGSDLQPQYLGGSLDLGAFDDLHLSRSPFSGGRSEARLGLANLLSRRHAGDRQHIRRCLNPARVSAPPRISARRCQHVDCEWARVPCRTR